MMHFFRRRKIRQYVRHLQHEARHARAMREDIADPALVENVRRAEATLSAVADGREEEVSKAGDSLSAAILDLYPRKSFPRWRENLEILVVALSVAMAFRTFFIQPFKIPTGSMQPTLNGITVKAQSEKKWMDYFPVNLVSLALFGTRYEEVRAKAGGYLDTRYMIGDDSHTYYISGLPHEMRKGLALRVRPGDKVTKGQVLASGRVTMGDHIFVDKIRYNFSRPKRGNIFVFDTDRIVHARIRPHSFYIKRLVGLPGEVISIEPPFLLVNGMKITEPYPFERLLNERDKGYNGYNLAATGGSDISAQLKQKGDQIVVGQDEYLPFGDNTDFSLDGRYFGPVKDKSVVGPAFMVYWPISKRWGFVR